MNLDLVPQRETGMTAYEMMLSESQERMLIVVNKGREQEIVDLFTKYDLEAVAVGEVTDDKNLRFPIKVKSLPMFRLMHWLKKLRFITSHLQNRNISVNSKA